MVAFFGGILLIAVIDKLVPSFENPHEMRRLEEMEGESCQIHSGMNSLMKMGMLTAVAIAVHNFPEGIATFIAALHDPHLGIAITLAIAIHNIPEGIAVSVPIFCATGSRHKAFIYSLLSGLSEPVGALRGYLFLLPTAREYGEPHIATYGLVAGMAVMAISLLLFI